MALIIRRIISCVLSVTIFFAFSCKNNTDKLLPSQNILRDTFKEVLGHPEKIHKWDEQTRREKYTILFNNALEIANVNDKTIIPILIEGLNTPEHSIHFHSSHVLRYLTSVDHNFYSYGSEEDRRVAYEKWKSWWHNNESKFVYEFTPIEQTTLVIDEIPGRINGNDEEPPGRVAYLDKEGEIIWETYKLKMPYDAVLLSDSTYLVNIIRERAVYKVSKDDLILQVIKVGGYPCSLELLDNGNILVAGWDDNVPGFVKEFNVSGKLVRHIENLRWPWKAQRLDNGNTLIADAGTNSVIEVDLLGNIVWSVENLGPETPELFDSLGPIFCQRIDNGNTLISIRGLSKIVEVDAEGNVVWEVGSDIVLNQYSARRLWNGNTLIADGGNFRVIEIDVEKNIVWEKAGFGYPAKAYRY